MGHDSRCACHVGATCGEPESQIEKPLSAIAEMAVDLGDPKASTNFRKTTGDVIEQRIDDLKVEDLYVIARAAQQTGYPMMQWPSILRDSLKSFLCTNNKVHRKCKMSSNGKHCRLPIDHKDECIY